MQNSPTSHTWNFFRTGGIDQVSLTTTEDLLSLDRLDQKLWVALSCPVKGLELDEKTLALIDSDNDGHIRVPELIAAVNWAAARLKNPATLLQGTDSLPLDAIDDTTLDGKHLLACAKKILASLGKAGASSIFVSATADTSKLFADSPLNGDGVIPPDATTDAETQALIKDIIDCLGGVPDRTGSLGVTAEKEATFFKELAIYVEWLEKSSSKDIAVLGTSTGAACAAIKAVRVKVDDYFARVRLAAFDSRAILALNRQETEYLTIVAKDLKITAEEVAGFPLARIEVGRALPLLAGINPAWSDALVTFHAAVITPVYGADKTSLTESEWTALTAKFAPYETWLGGKAGSVVEKLGLDRAKTLLGSKARAGLAGLLAEDKALEPEFNAISAVDRLVRYYRDLRTLLHNFINFADFYSADRLATFQAGMLYLDSRSCELCIRVEDPATHAILAVTSKAYITYLDCKRAGSSPIKIAACFTQGDSDYLFVGRNGVFYDRQGRDWDATITKIVDNPISLRQAFWSPYKKFVRMIEEQVAKRAAAADAAANTKLATAAEVATQTAVTPPGPPPGPKKIDIGTVAALGVAVGAIGGALATVATGLTRLEYWQLPVVLVAVILVISLPSVIIAAIKLRQRTVGPLLDANGWAINGRVRINIPFGTALTQRAELPPGSTRSLTDPYADKNAVRRRRLAVFLIVVVLSGLITAKVLHTWPFHPQAPATAATAVVVVPATPAPAK
ncbi:MAG: hypothetical protein ABI222_12240 [Opitutaceae bacterium]